MHELALMESVVQTVAAHVEGARVRVVRLEVGRLTCVMPDALRMSFDVCAEGTPLEGATLEIDEIPGRGRCRACGAELELEPFPSPCPCGSFDVETTSGQELRIREVEVT